MSNPRTTYQIMETESLHFVIGENIPKSEIERVGALDGRVITLGSTALLDVYESWLECHKESAEPFTGWLVRDTADLHTEADKLLDAAEELMDRKTEQGKETDPKIVEGAEVLAVGIANSPEFTADSARLESLAKLVGSVTIKHSEQQRKDYEVREFYLSGDPDDPDFLLQAYERYGSEADSRMSELIDEQPGLLFTDTPGSFRHEGEFQDAEDEMKEEAQAIIERRMLNTVPESLLRKAEVDMAYDFLHQTILPELLEETTTINAAQQIEKEAKSYGFSLTQI